jgi:hypothetical protein
VGSHSSKPLDLAGMECVVVGEVEAFNSLPDSVSRSLDYNS